MSKAELTYERHPDGIYLYDDDEEERVGIITRDEDGFWAVEIKGRKCIQVYRALKAAKYAALAEFIESNYAQGIR